MKYVGDKEHDWDLYLDAVLFSYRVSRQASTKYSPFYLMYGRHARLPVEFKKQKDDEPEHDGEINIEGMYCKLMKIT